MNLILQHLETKSCKYRGMKITEVETDMKII